MNDRIHTFVGCAYSFTTYPDSKVHGANMRPIWSRQDPGGPHEIDVEVIMMITHH